MEPALILLILAFGLLIGGVLMWQKGSHLMSVGRKAEAVVFMNNFHHSKSGGTYHPVVRFLTDKQEWITQELNFGVKPAIAEGTRLQVIYDPENPGNVQVYSVFLLGILPRILVAAGICGVIFGALEYLEIITIFPN